MQYDYARPTDKKKEDKAKKTKTVKLVCLGVAVTCVIAAAIVAVVWFTNNVSVDGKMVHKNLVVDCNGLTVYLGQEIDPVDVADEMDLPIIEKVSDAKAGVAGVGVEGKFIVYLQKSGREYYVSGWKILEEGISYAGISVGDDIEDVVKLFPEGQAYGRDGTGTAVFYVYFDMDGNVYNTAQIWKLWNEAAKSKSELAKFKSEYPALLVEWDPYSGEVTSIKLTVSVEE